VNPQRHARLEAGIVYGLFAPGAVGSEGQTTIRFRFRNPDGLKAEGENTLMSADPNFACPSIHTFGVHSAEVGVDTGTGEIHCLRVWSK
jgi:CO/xanthine dehydrogenase Mo-binding subunit